MKELIRKYQKLIIVGVALSVVAIYVFPLDHLVAATAAQDQVHARFDAARAQVQASSLPPDVKYSTIQQLNQQEASAIAQLQAAGL